MAAQAKHNTVTRTPPLTNIQHLLTTRFNLPEATANRRRQLERRLERWWVQASRGERLVTVAVIVGGTVAIVNSAAWAIALSYIMRQRRKAAEAARQSVREAAQTAAAAAEELADELQDWVEVQ